MGRIPAWPDPDLIERSRLRFTTEKFTTRAQPEPAESNAVPDRIRCLTDYERGPFWGFRDPRAGALFGRA
jgi:hypothetical protein